MDGYLLAEPSFLEDFFFVQLTDKSSVHIVK